MDMPISTIITLFIVIAVGAMILMFSQNMIGQAQDNINVNTNTTVPQNQILDVQSTSTTQIALLADDCYNTHYGKIFKKENCFVVHSATEYTPSKSAIKALMKSDSNALGQVTESATTSVFIFWDPANQQVGVTK